MSLSGPHRQQEEQSRQPEEPPQPQVQEQPPGSPAWALPAPTPRPGMAATRRQVGAGVTCRTLSTHQALGAPQRAQDPEDHPVLGVQCGMSDLWSLGSHACPTPWLPPAFQKCLSSQVEQDPRLASCLRRTWPVWLLASGPEMEDCCQGRAAPFRPKALHVLPVGAARSMAHTIAHTFLQPA